MAEEKNGEEEECLTRDAIDETKDKEEENELEKKEDVEEEEEGDEDEEEDHGMDSGRYGLMNRLSTWRNKTNETFTKQASA
eukprot:14757037-Ditylum_brightwellii.AAC.1